MFPIHDENRPSETPYVNYGLLLINITVFFYLFLTGDLWRGIRSLGAIPSQILGGERFWTLFSSMFMHADIMHLFGNMLYLWVFGDNIEDALGHTKYLAFYLLGGLTATFAHIGSLYITLPTLGGPAGFDIPSVGASGAISAVLGAYLLLYPRAKIRTLTFYFFITVVTIPAYYYLGFWFVYQILMGMFSLSGLYSGVAFWAHIGGFLAGLLSVKVFGVRSRVQRMAVSSRKPIRPLVVSSQVRRPLVDLILEESRIRVVAELPGIQLEDIRVKVSEMEVIIEAEHGAMRFYKQIPLPTPVIPKIEDIYYRNGVLNFFLNMA